MKQIYELTLDAVQALGQSALTETERTKMSVELQSYLEKQCEWVKAIREAMEEE